MIVTTGTSSPAKSSARERTRRLMLAEVAAAAFELFFLNGFDQTTAEDIAGAAGISRATFFRYFATKEDVVVGTLAEFSQPMLQVLEAQPDDTHPWAALRLAITPLLEAQSTPQGLRVAKLLHDTPSLQARHYEKTIGWHEALTPEIARRLGTAGDATDPRAAALVGSALACLTAASEAWVASDSTRSLSELLDDAMSVVPSGAAVSHRR